MEYKLSKEADALLCLLYANYKQRNKTMPREDARLCGGLDDIQELTVSALPADDIGDLCRELRQNNLLEAASGDDDIYFCWLSLEAISYMSNRAKTEIKKVVAAVFVHLPPVLSLIL